MKKFDLSSLGKWIILATVLGAVTGLVMGKDASMFAPVGNLFMTLIKMIVVPMVFFSLVGGAASLGNSKSAGKIGLVTFLYYGVTTAVAVVLGILVGVVVCHTFALGIGYGFAFVTFFQFSAVGGNEGLV